MLGADRASATNSATLEAGGFGEAPRGLPLLEVKVNEVGGIGLGFEGLGYIRVIFRAGT